MVGVVADGDPWGCWLFRFASVNTVDDDSDEAITAETDGCLDFLGPLSVEDGEYGSCDKGARISVRDKEVAWSTFSRSSDNCDERI